ARSENRQPRQRIARLQRQRKRQRAVAAALFAAELIIIFETAVELEKFNRSNLLTKSQSWPSSACTKPENSYRKTLHEPLGYSRFIKPVAWVFVPCQFVSQRYLALAAQALDAFGL